jgi:hypothetical protein
MLAGSLVITKAAKLHVGMEFERARRKAAWRDWLSRLTRRSNDLVPLQQARQTVSIAGQSFQGVQTVPLDRILGTMDRAADFDRAFFPRQPRLRERWLRVNQAYYGDVILPPVDLIKLGEVYFVKDGHHRISVARAHGQDFIEANVTEIYTSAARRPEQPERA